jgi:hypothetical protein
VTLLTVVAWHWAQVASLTFATSAGDPALSLLDDPQPPKTAANENVHSSMVTNVLFCIEYSSLLKI